MTTKAAIYLRVSTEEQGDTGYGLDAQRTKCEAMATVKGWDVAAVYTDEGISGTKGRSDRPALEAMMTAACGGEVGAVIVSSLDRLGRNTRLVLQLIDELDGCGAVIVSCRESLDTTTPTGRFTLTMFAALAQLDRDQIVERTTDGRNARGRIDGERGGRLPFGYCRPADGIAVDPGAAEVVRRIFAMRGDGYRLTDIATALNGDGIASPRGAAWHPSSVHYILKSEDAYRGGRRWESPVNWPAILEA